MFDTLGQQAASLEWVQLIYGPPPPPNIMQTTRYDLEGATVRATVPHGRPPCQRSEIDQQRSSADTVRLPAAHADTVARRDAGYRHGHLAVMDGNDRTAMISIVW
ncbi:MAG: hypothetical protein GW893_03105 [Armatimonadetes bacterium]|nr:hypothetical protein [Armatimonadota bacterium]